MVCMSSSHADARMSCRHSPTVYVSHIFQAHVQEASQLFIHEDTHDTGALCKRTLSCH